MNLVQIQKEIMSLRRDLRDLKQSYTKDKTELEACLATATGRLNTAKAGMDNAKLDLAATVLRVTGDLGDSKQRAEAVESAIMLIAGSEKPMFERYVGVKIYSGFGDQREDHVYGYGPKHGRIVFRIESLERGRAWTEEERDAAIYYLLNLSEIQKAQEAAA